MSYIVLLLLITGGYVLGAPILQESLQFRIVECIPGENDTLSKHILEVTNVNETCIRVNKSSPEGTDVYLYVVPATETGVRVQITTENCSTPLPDLHLSLCDDENDFNSTEIMATFGFQDVSIVDTLDDNVDNSTTEAFPYTGPTVYETLHHFNQDEDEDENQITSTPSSNAEKAIEEADTTSSEEDK